MGDRIYDIYPQSFHFHHAHALEQKEVLGLLKRKIFLLKDLNYIINGGISRKAELASKTYSFELQIGELFDSGYLEGLDEESLFIVITALAYEPRRGERKPRLNKKIKSLKNELNRFIAFIHKEERIFRVFPLSKKFYFHLSEAASAWYFGTNFNRLSKICEVDEGEIVRYFRMSIQVLREMRTSQAINEQLKTKIINCLHRVKRDVVDAEKQLRQEI
jgi:superfamily II RNA helicase